MSEPLFKAGPAWLFCPADRPDRYASAAAASDVVILDLEDAVAAGDKPAAREALAGSVLDAERTVVRVNPRGSGEQERDLEALHETAYRYVMVPKAESSEDFAALSGYGIIALCESPRGVLGASELAAHPDVVALTWGAEDLVAEIGGTSSRAGDGGYRGVARHARSAMLLAAAAAGRPALDTVFLDIGDTEGLRATAADAHGSGFVGMMCIHPRQVPVIHAAFAPAPEQVEWAGRVLEAAERAGRGVFAFEGRMVDEPVLIQARRMVAHGRKGS